MNFRKATHPDIPSILVIIQQAQHYLKQHSIDQWQNGYPNHDSITNDIQNGCSYVMEENGTIIGTMAFILEEEPTYAHIYEGSWKTNGLRYATLHRVAVLEERKGSGIAGKMLQEAELLCRSCSIGSIRMDTHRENLSMQRMMQKNNFAYCGIIYLEDDAERLAYEKLLS